MPTCTRDLELVPRTPNYDLGRVSHRRGEYYRRPGVYASPRQQQLAVASINLQCPGLPNGPILHRLVCFKDQPSITHLLQLEAQSGGLDCGCILNILGQNDTLYVCLVGRTLLKIQRDHIKFACLVATAWPGQVLTMLVALPKLLLSHNYRPHPLQTEGSLCLTTWPISGNHMKHRTFHRELQSVSLAHGRETQM